MNIERDKWYLRRDGGREFVVCVDRPGRHSGPIVSHDEEGHLTIYYADGRLVEGQVSPADLVAFAPEPVRGYVVVDELGCFDNWFDNDALDAAREYIVDENSGYRILDLSTAKEVSDDQ